MRNGRAKSREPGENIARPVGGPAKKCCQEVATHLRRGGRGALSLELMGQRPDPGGVGREERGGREEPVRITRRPPPAGQCGQCAAAARAPWRGRRPRSPPWSMSPHPCGAHRALSPSPREVASASLQGSREMLSTGLAVLFARKRGFQRHHDRAPCAVSSESCRRARPVTERKQTVFNCLLDKYD